MNYEKLEKILEMIAANIESAEDYYTSNEINPVAEYVASMGYGGEIFHLIEDSLNHHENYLDDFDPEEIEFLRGILKLPRAEAVEQLQEITFLRHVNNIRHATNSIYRHDIGEIDHQFNDEIAESLNGLSPEEIDKLIELDGRENRISAITRDGKKEISNSVYLSMNYEAWVLVVDRKLLKEKMKTKNKLRVLEGRK